MRLLRTAQDVLEQAVNLPEWEQNYWQLTGGLFHGQTRAASLPGIQLFQESMNRSVDQLGQAPKGRLVLGVPNAMQGEGFWSGQPLHTEALLVLRDGEELAFRTPASSDMSFIAVEYGLLQQYAQQVEQVDFCARRDRLGPVMPLTPVLAARMRQVLQLALDHALQDGDELGLAELEADLCSLCLEAIGAVPLDAASRAGQRVQRYLVNAVRERVLARPDDPPSVAALATELNVSRRTLHHAFTQVLGINPVNYMRTVRLHQARKALRAQPDSPGRVRDVAVEYGFWHLGLFAQHYRALFGERPSHTLPVSH